MEKLRETVINLASVNLKAKLSSSQIAVIDQRLREYFPPDLRIPSHPTYATMILKAIAELSKENGSSEDSISEYIQANYEDLPWAHMSILNHHLNKLCDDGVIVLTATNMYLTSPVTPKRGRKKGNFKRKQIMMKQRVTRQNNSGTEVLEEKQHSIGSDNHDLIEHKNVKHGCRNLVIFEENVDETGQEEPEKENSLIIKFSIPDLVKSRTRKTQKSCDQDKNRNENIASEENSSGEEWMNSGASLENPVKKKKKVGGDTEVHEIVYAIAKQLPETAKSGRRVTRQLINSKEQQNKLIFSTVSKFPSSELQKEGLSLTNNPVGNDIDCGITKRSLKSEESGRRTSKLKKRDKLEWLLSISSGETKSKWPSWIPSLLQTNFNGNCEVHGKAGKSVCNLFCSYCKNGALCSSCVASHEDHHVILIRQSDVELFVDISDVGMLDLSGIRTFKHAIVLKKEFAPWASIPANNSCILCDSRVPYPFKFCSLKCKFEHEV